MNCSHCGYPSSDARGCDNPGCIKAYWRTPADKQAMAERYSRERAQLDAQARERAMLARAQSASYGKAGAK